MAETTPLDRRLLRALRRPGSHAYALAQESADDRATVYRRLARLQAAGLVASRAEPGRGARRKTLRLTAAGQEALRDELRDALRLLLEAFDASAPRRGGEGGGDVKPPVVFASGSRVSGVELRIARHLARAHPRAVHLVVPPGCQVDARGVPTMEAPWSALPFRDGYARTLFVNELPPARGLGAAASEWRRVLSRGGRVNVVAPAPLPRGVDPFVDWFAELQDELFPDQRGAPTSDAVTRALRERFAGVRSWRQGTQIVWTARG